MSSQLDWRRVYDFWFPMDLSRSGIAAHWQMMTWWFHGEAQAELRPFAPLVHAARAGGLDHWRATPQGRLSLIIVLDRFPRGLFAGTPQAYSSDPDALRIAEEGFGNGHYGALASPYEEFFYLLPLVHAEGPDHVDRMGRVVAIAERALAEAPEDLKPVWQFTLGQARTRFDIISRFGRFPHRNPVLGRASTPQELTYMAKDDFIHTRSLPVSASSAISAIG
ncbi:DUF924 family protein [Microvirga lotononidis]|uniref:DUF924 domain-containing protein n=1 Tax=Microvirga lotononidis TaxID=864069 RepID=I4YNK7_9HYPH|nr:DUF924 family protein [Microvirga lotononidis]EIM25549.1 hypothetical protein MicloDRAFT_00062760 [Microvirga lotononidis]WQO26143.1 DUF924 family protein [Microvirga lotononidis]